LGKESRALYADYLTGKGVRIKVPFTRFEISIPGQSNFGLKGLELQYSISIIGAAFE
jgi:hypothetical protein